MREELPRYPVDVDSLVRGMLQTYPNLQPSEAELSIECYGAVVQGNEAGLTQCFSNLLGNAVKFVPRGDKPRVRVWAEYRGDRVRIWVEDAASASPRSTREPMFSGYREDEYLAPVSGWRWSAGGATWGNRRRGIRAGQGKQIWVELAGSPK
jgi:C4-dicarboxylate-specific signal transduction histidine kinase